MTAYKVVRVTREGRYKSSWVIGKGCRTYRIGRMTKPVPSTGLFAFSKYSDACKWADGMSRFHQISFKVLKGQGRRRWKPRWLRYGAPVLSMITRAWSPNNRNVGCETWPTGTIALESFTPEAEIEVS